MENRKFRVFSILADLLILAASFLIMAALKPAGIIKYINSHYPVFLILTGTWVVVSLLNGKIGRGKIINIRVLFSRVLSSNIISISVAALIMYTFREYAYSRAVVLGTALTATIFELIIGTVYVSFRKATIQEPEAPQLTEKELVASAHRRWINNIAPNPAFVDLLMQGAGKEKAEAIASMVNCAETTKLAVVSTDEIFNIMSLPEGEYSCIINLKPMNSVRQLDDFLDMVNKRLNTNGSFVCCVETLDQRRMRRRHSLSFGLYYLILPFDFVINRMFPRLRITRRLWSYFTGGSNPPLSRAESLGRLCRAGFEIRMEKFAGNILCILSQRRSSPLPLNDNGYGMIIALSRIGLGGNPFKAYKLRTMHPYSEYIQDYVYLLHDLQQGGKLKHDFRVTSWGRFCRRIWLDELPMLVNYFTGDMKLVGVRPLSKHYFDLYSEELQKRRINYKPGLIPPFYADMPKNLEEIQRSEARYLDAWDKHPCQTEIKYFFRSVFNILFRYARSN